MTILSLSTPVWYYLLIPPFLNGSEQLSYHEDQWNRFELPLHRSWVMPLTGARRRWFRERKEEENSAVIVSGINVSQNGGHNVCLWGALRLTFFATCSATRFIHTLSFLLDAFALAAVSVNPKNRKRCLLMVLMCVPTLVRPRWKKRVAQAELLFIVLPLMGINRELNFRVNQIRVVTCLPVCVE